MTARRFFASACLCGFSCRYDGRNVPHPALESLREKGLAVPVCPELLGGLPTPRPPCEIRGGRVLDAENADKTAEFFAGAEKTLDLARDMGITRAVLKNKSPSCGSGVIYDGSFSGALIPGMGVTAALLAANGVAVFSEDAWEKMLL